MATFNKVLAKAVPQEYIYIAKNAKREILIAAYQGLENYHTLVYYAVEAKITADKA